MLTSQAEQYVAAMGDGVEALEKRPERGYDVALRGTSSASLAPWRRRGLWYAKELRGVERRFVLKRGAFLAIRYEDGVFIAEVTDLPIDGFGETEQKAIDAFGEMFDMQWAALVDATTPLTANAMALRDRMKALVERVFSHG